MNASKHARPGDGRWLERVGVNYAHQGGAREAPSSTMHAFRRAVALGAQGLEMDVHRTADGHLVVAHDQTIDRTTNSRGRIDALTLDELRALDFAHWWAPGHDAVYGLDVERYELRGLGPQDPAFGVTLLSDVLAEFPGVLLNFDLKGGAVPYEVELANALRVGADLDLCIVASFDDRSLAQFRSVAPEISTASAQAESWAIGGWLNGGPEPQRLPSSLVALQVPFRLEPGGTPLFGEQLVRRAHEEGLAVHVWTIDDEAEMELLLGIGVDALMTDRPSVAEAVLERTGVERWRNGEATAQPGS